MSLTNLARYVRCLSLCLIATPAVALPKLHVEPVELLGYAGDQLRISVELPCGSSFYGLVAAVDAKTSTLKLAAAVAQDSMVCTAFPEPVEIRVDYVATTQFKAIAPMKVTADSRISIAKISDLSVGRDPSGQPHLTAVYTPRCGRDLGALLHPAGEKRLELAFVERQGQAGQPAGACTAPVRVRGISALDLTSSYHLAALSDKPKSLSRAFRLRLAPVRASSVQALVGGGLSMEYRRACNQAPVGVALGAPQRVNGETHARLGMLVAEYYNVSCVDSDVGGVWNKAEERAVAIPRGLKVDVATGGDYGELTLHAPSKLVRSTTGPLLEVSYLATCGDSYAVYGHDARGTIGVGVLTQEGPASRCKSKSGEVSLSQPYVASNVPASQLYPMQLRGLVAH